MKKKIFSIALSLIMLLMASVCFTACSQKGGTKGLKYELSIDGSYAIFLSSGTATDEHLVISDTYEGKPVTEIASMSIADSRGSVVFKSITIPATVTKINFKAIISEDSQIEIRYEGTAKQFKDIEGSNNITRVVCLG